MAGTIRTKAQIDALLADNASGDINAQDVRDATVSAWGDRYVGDLVGAWPAADAGEWVTISADDEIDGQAVLEGQTWRCGVDATPAATPANWVMTRAAGTIVRRFYGVQDFGDVATQTTPIAVSNGSWSDLPNDGLGALSSQVYSVIGHGPIYNASSGEFEFTDLALGDMIMIRVDVEFLTTSPNTEVALRLAFGPAFAFGLPFDRTAFKSAASAGSGQRVRYFPFQMKTLDTLNNPAKLQATTDSGSVTIKVNGWQIETTVVV